MHDNTLKTILSGFAIVSRDFRRGGGNGRGIDVCVEGVECAGTGYWVLERFILV